MNTFVDTETDVQQDHVIIQLHPVKFMIMLILFFVTMDFWSNAAQKVVETIHPTGDLNMWEYLLVASLSLLLLVLVARWTGIRISNLDK